MSLRRQQTLEEMTVRGLSQSTLDRITSNKHLSTKNPDGGHGTKENQGLWPVSGVDRALPSTLYRQKLTLAWPSQHLLSE